MQSYSRYHPDDPKIRVWDSDFEKVWGFRVLVVADQWRQAQQRDRAQANASPNASPPQVAGVAPTIAKNHGLVGPGRQGGLDIVQQPPPQIHHGDTGVDHRYGQHHQIGRARPYISGAEFPVQAPLVRTRDGAPNLPSLKASGLLDTFPPPADAFSTTLSLSPQGTFPPQDDRRSVTTLLNSPMQPLRGNVQVASSPMMPIGLDWQGKS